jgi:CDP-glycerol glycerophosphotransferase
MWDFSFTGKPCFLYTSDLSDYDDQRGFYTPIESWPYPRAETSDELIDKIKKFDIGTYRKALNIHHNALGSYESGTAASKFCSIIFSNQNQNKEFI